MTATKENNYITFSGSDSKVFFNGKPKWEVTNIFFKKFKDSSNDIQVEGVITYVLFDPMNKMEFGEVYDITVVLGNEYGNEKIFNILEAELVSESVDVGVDKLVIDLKQHFKAKAITTD